MFSVIFYFSYFLFFIIIVQSSRIPVSFISTHFVHFVGSGTIPTQNYPDPEPSVPITIRSQNYPNPDPSVPRSIHTQNYPDPR